MKRTVDHAVAVLCTAVTAVGADLGVNNGEGGISSAAREGQRASEQLSLECPDTHVVHHGPVESGVVAPRLNESDGREGGSRTGRPGRSSQRRAEQLRCWLCK